MHPETHSNNRDREARAHKRVETGSFWKGLLDKIPGIERFKTKVETGTPKEQDVAGQQINRLILNQGKTAGEGLKKHLQDAATKTVHDEPMVDRAKLEAGTAALVHKTETAVATFIQAEDAALKEFGSEVQEVPTRPPEQAPTRYRQPADTLENGSVDAENALYEEEQRFKDPAVYLKNQLKRIQVGIDAFQWQKQSVLEQKRVSKGDKHYLAKLTEQEEASLTTEVALEEEKRSITETLNDYTKGKFTKAQEFFAERLKQLEQSKNLDSEQRQTQEALKGFLAEMQNVKRARRKINEQKIRAAIEAPEMVVKEITGLQREFNAEVAAGYFPEFEGIAPDTITTEQLQNIRNQVGLEVMAARENIKNTKDVEGHRAHSVAKKKLESIDLLIDLKKKIIKCSDKLSIVDTNQVAA